MHGTRPTNLLELCESRPSPGHVIIHYHNMQFPATPHISDEPNGLQNHSNGTAVLHAAHPLDNATRWHEYGMD